MLPGTERAVAKGDREAGCTGPLMSGNAFRYPLAGRHKARQSIVAINEHFNSLDAFLRERPAANHTDAAVHPIVPRSV